MWKSQWLRIVFLDFNWLVFFKSSCSLRNCGGNFRKEIVIRQHWLIEKNEIGLCSIQFFFCYFGQRGLRCCLLSAVRVCRSSSESVGEKLTATELKMKSNLKTIVCILWQLLASGPVKKTMEIPQSSLLLNGSVVGSRYGICFSKGNDASLGTPLKKDFELRYISGPT